MKTSTRYSLIGLGFFIFIILAPSLVLYVSGTRLNFGSRDTDNTGIFDAKSNPTDATLYINDVKHSNTPATARFLNQGEYVFSLKKDGYHDWSKRLPIEAGGVTFAQEGVSEIQLFKKGEPVTMVPNGVSSFAIIKNQIWFARDNSIVSMPFDDPDNQIITQIGFKAEVVVPLRNDRYLYIGPGTLFDTMTRSTIVIPPRDSLTVNAPENIAVINDHILYITNVTLLSYNISTKEITTVRDNVSALTAINTTLYFSVVDDLDARRATIYSSNWNSTALTDAQPLITNTSLAEFLYITDNKELFCLCGGALSRVGSTLETVGSQILAIHLDARTNELAFINSNEFSFYNFIASKSQLITRGFLQRNTPFIVRSSIGYAFIGNSLGLEAIEIDTRDHQNRYQLLSGKPVYQIVLTENQKTIIALQDGSLVSLEIRN